MAKCYIHENKQAKARCKVCKKVMCEDCMPAYPDEERVCPVCRKQELEKDVNNYFKILLFICVAFVAAAVAIFMFVKNFLKGFSGINLVGVAIICVIILAGVGFFVYLFIVDYRIYHNCLTRLNIANEYLNKQSEKDLDVDETEQKDNLEEDKTSEEPTKEEPKQEENNTTDTKEEQTTESPKSESKD